MKTNHRRGFKAKTHRWQGMTGVALSQTEKAIVGKHIAAGTNCNSSNGNRGMSYQKAGAKKFVRSRFRFHAKAALKKELGEDV